MTTVVDEFTHEASSKDNESQSKKYP